VLLRAAPRNESRQDIQKKTREKTHARNFFWIGIEEDFSGVPEWCTAGVGLHTGEGGIVNCPIKKAARSESRRH